MTSSRLSRALRLVVAGLVAVVPLGLWAAFVVDGRHRALDVAEADTRRLVATVAEHATRLLDAQALVLEVMERAAGGRDCAALRVDAGLQASMAAMVRRASGTETAWVLDVNGTLCAASDPARLDDRSRADREYFVAARAAPTGQDIVGRAISGRIDDVPAFTLARRRGEGDAFSGIVLTAVDLRDVLRYWRETLNTRPTQRIALFRRDGATIARSFEPLVPPPDPEAERRIAVALWASRLTGSAAGASPVDGERRVGAWQTLAGWEVVATTTMTVEEALAPWRSAAVRSLPVALFASLLLALVVVGLVRNRSRLKAANLLLERRVQDRTAAMRDGAERLRLAVETAALGIIEWDLAAGTVRLDRGAAGVFRHILPADRLLALDGPERAAWRSRLEAEDRTARDARQASLLRGEVDATSGEYRLRLPGPDGTEETCIIAARSAVVARDAAGLPCRIIEVVQDVTPARHAEAALDESRMRLQAVLDNVPVAVVLAEAPTGRIVFGNRAVERVFRHPLLRSGHPEDYVAWEGYHADGRRVLGHEYPLARVLATGEPASLEVHYACGDGVRRWLRVDGAPVRDEAGRLTAALVICTDIDERRCAEEALRQSEARFRASQDLSSIPFCILRAVRDDDGTVIDFTYEYVNAAAARALAPVAHDLQGIRYLDFLPERRDHPLLFPRYVAVLRGEDDGAEVEIPYNTRGISGWMRNAVTRLDSERIAVSFADISAAKAAETRRTLLLDIADRLRSAPGAAAAYAAEVLGRHLGACRLGYGEVSADGSTLTIAQEHVAPGLPSAVGTHMLDAFGTALAAELRAGRTVTITDVAEDPRTRSEAAAHLAFGSRAVLAVPLLRGGRLRATLHVSRPEPRPWSAEEVALVEDVAARIWSTLEQARAEDALREGEERLRLATGAAEVGFWDVDLVNDVLVWPPIVKAMFGISADAPVSMADFYAGLHPEDREATTTAFAAACDPVRRALYDVEYRTVGKEDGIIRWVAAKGRGVFDEAGRAVRVIGAALDITARKAAEAALREREAEAREAQRLARVGSWRWDAATDATTGSDELYRIYGLDPASGPFPDFSAQRGTLYPEAEWDRIAAAVRHAVETGEGYALDVRALRNGAPIWVTTRCEVLRDAAGRVTALRGTVQDITERRTAEEALATREAELRRLNETLEVRVREEIAAREAAQAQLAHAQRMEALGQLAGGIAHDINNVLQAVGGGAALIERKPGEPDHVRRIARMVIEAAERGSAVTRRLLAFSRRADLRAESLDPVMLLTDLRDMLAHTMGAGIGVRVEAPPRLPTVLADKGQLETVLVNLAANARDAMDGQGTITLSAALETRRAMQAIGDPPMLKPGRYVRLAVHDTGAGMTPEVLARATEPFFTTKPRGKGTGLGLAMARGFAEQSGGGLRLDSEPGRGTVVSLWLPLAVAVAPADETPSPPAAPAHGRRILIVDDDAAVREVTAGGLEAAGYAVLTAGDGPAALEIIKRDDRVDLLISDLSMPGMDGLAVIAAAQSLRPGLPAILLTGYATNAAELALDGAMSGAFSLLRKPIAIAPLAERVAAVLEGVPAGQG